MSFATFKGKPVSSKVALLEFGTSAPHSFFLNEEPGIWRFDWRVSEDVSYGFETGAFCYGSFENGGAEVLSNGNPEINIISLTVDGNVYAEVANLVNLRATNESFWWDGDVLRVHFDGFAPPWVFLGIKVGVAVNQANKPGVYDGRYYDGRLKSLSDLTIKTDPLYYKILGYNGLTAELENSDGEFDGLTALDIFGQVVKVLYGEQDAAYADFELLYSGIIESFSLSAEAMRLTVADKRKWFQRSVPVKVFDVATYPDIKDNNANKPIPLAYGVLRGVPAMCTNEAAVAPASYSFKLADTTYHGIKAIDEVRVAGIVKVPASTNLATATFTLVLADYAPGQAVVADIQGYESGGALIENALEVIKDLLANYADIPYIVDQYDLAEWAAATALAPDIGVLIDSIQAIESIIENICVSLNGIMFVRATGKFTFRYLHAAKAIDETIPREEILEEPVINYASDDFLSSVVLYYDRDHEARESLTHLDESLEADFLAAYGTTRRYEAETLLNALADAQALAGNLLATYCQVAQWTAILTNISHIQLELVDDVTVNLDRASKGRFGEVDFRVYGIRKNLMDGVVELTLRKI